MILFRAGFTKKTSADYDHVEELVISYFHALMLNGQVCGSYYVGWDNDEIVVITRMPAPNAIRPQFNSKRGAHAYDEMMTVLRKKPVWTHLAADRNQSYTTHKDSPFLYLYTDASTIEPPVRAGHTGVPIPIHTISLTDSIREELYYWSDRYSDHDGMWINSGTLEKAAYRELTHLDSELTKEGRELCEQIQTATQIPTYYYMMRYYQQKRGEEKRRCPGCNQAWQHLPTINVSPFHESYLKCDPCRLVSHFGFSLKD